ncbi:cysteine desulfurase-like protein [Reticulibacter mediterranei]|uniref:Cysteine desulfurase-like protein n=1 Tax=Reticulibacter mediterranei TaxID=2778369 RepID=A0A8J3N3U5_9CHLR|nr:cysteine desulfurase-like protein [Reticulibacter mediterranei]GHO94763.1 cysteine desulfurase-like protein [Reticulibacter mediterranei]
MLQTDTVRTHFPSLKTGAIFFDNPGGTQVAQETIQRMQEYFLTSNANNGGAFHTSVASDATIAEARQAVADFLHAARPEEIVFGQNMTSLTLHISRSLARTLQPGDELVATRLDHDANVAPWLLIAEDRGCQVRWVDFHPEDCTLNMEEMERQITPRTKIVAVGYASNAVGTINDVQRVVQLAHAVGAVCFIDAVQLAPHRGIDVQALDCDFLACSAYKFFGPHTGILYGKYDLLDRLTAYKVRPSGKLPPDKFETGTQSFESISGILGVLEYLSWLGITFGSEFAAQYQNSYSGRGLALKQGMAAIEAYELDINKALVKGLTSVPGLHLYGITDLERMNQRVPTFSFTLQGHSPRAVAEALAGEQIYVWDGNFYALSVTEQLGLEDHGGLVRVGLTHYNTYEEIEKLITALHKLAK